jgi:hypothetical protein
MYLDSAASNLETHNVGHGTTEWPYLLADVPAAMPTIIKTVQFDGHPVAAHATYSYDWHSRHKMVRVPNTPNWDQPDPHYATFQVLEQEGKLTVFSAGKYVPGRKPTPQAPTPSEIDVIGTQELGITGTNMTGLTSVTDYELGYESLYDVNDGTPSPQNEMVLVNDRGTKRIMWVKFGLGAECGTATLVRTVEHQDMDNIAVEQLDPYGIDKGTVSVASYATGQIINIQFKDVIERTGNDFCENPGDCPPAGIYGASVMGVYATGNKPFALKSSNAP